MVNFEDGDDYKPSVFQWSIPSTRNHVELILEFHLLWQGLNNKIIIKNGESIVDLLYPVKGLVHESKADNGSMQIQWVAGMRLLLRGVEFN